MRQTQNDKREKDEEGAMQKKKQRSLQHFPATELLTTHALAPKPACLLILSSA